MQDGPEFIFLWLFLKVSWHIFDKNNNPSHTMLISNENSELILSTCVNFNDEMYH